MAQVNIRIEDGLKEQADELFEDLGLNMSTAFTIFIKTAIRHKGIPFELTTNPIINENNKPISTEDGVAEVSEREIKFGFLKDKVPPLPDSFFDPLPEEELQLWGL